MSDVREMKTPYTNLKGKRNNPSSAYLMLAELIDNSVASWEKSSLNNNLQVVVDFNFRDKEIRVVDTAAGMSADELLDSVELNVEKTGNVLNMFGVGMKNSAFWFGQDLHIRTNNGKETNSTKVMLSNKSDRDLMTPITWTLEKDKPLNHRGTEIFIRHMYDDRKLSNDDLKSLINITQNKYKKYLTGEVDKNGHSVSIIINVYDKLGKQSKYKLQGKETNPQVIPADSIKDFLDNWKKVSSEERILVGLKKQVVKKVKNGEPLEFDFKIKWKTHPIDLKIGITSQTSIIVEGKTTNNENKVFKHAFGITAYQKDRAIRIAPINPIKFPKYDYTRTDIKRVYGFMELGDIFRPDNNKQNFNFGAHKASFNDFINKIGDDIFSLAHAVKLVMGQKTKTGKATSSKSREKLQMTLSSKSTKFDWDKITSKGAVASFIGEDKVKYTFEIKEVDVSNVEDLNYFVSAKAKNGSSTEFVITYNVENPIWKPLANNTTTIDMKSVTYPLIAIFGLADLGIKNDLLSKWLGQEGDDYLKIISMVAKFGLKIE